MVTFSINFQADGRNLNLKRFYCGLVISFLPMGDKILTHRVKSDQNTLDSMAMSPDREIVSIELSPAV